MIFNYLPTFAQATVGSVFSFQPRAIIFIDGSNLYHSLRNSFGSAKIDFEKFCAFVGSGKKIVKIYYYTSPVSRLDEPEKYGAQQRFLGRIGKINGFEIFLGRLEKRPAGNRVEKGVDVKLAVDLLVNAFDNKYDEAILISNDADFVPAIEEVQKLRKRVLNVAFPKSRSFHLSKVCDGTIDVLEPAGFLQKLH